MIMELQYIHNTLIPSSDKPVAFETSEIDMPIDLRLRAIAIFSSKRPSALPSIRPSKRTPSNTLMVSRYFFRASSYYRRSARVIPPTSTILSSFLKTAL